MDRVKNFHPVQRAKAHVPGIPGRGKKDPPARTDINARPLTALKDPYSFGPPPRRDPNAPIPPAPGAQIDEEAASEDETDREPQPYRMNTTGFDPTTLPKPPRRDDPTSGSQSPSLPARTNTASPALPSRNTPTLPARKPPPSLPARTSSSTDSRSPERFSRSTGPDVGGTTQAASLRLANAGISVPGFNIGGGGAHPTMTTTTSTTTTTKPRAPLPPPRSPSMRDDTSSPVQTSAPGSTLMAQQSGMSSELSERLSRMRVKSSTDSSPTRTPLSPPPSYMSAINNTSTSMPSNTTTSGTGTRTTWSQKQAALKTATSLQNDPSSVSLSDVRSAASTANNFRQRHGDQVANAYRQAEQVASDVDDRRANDTIPSNMAMNKKKPLPPPVPKKKATLVEGSVDAAPPPIPLASKPR